jgi:hypothetical protein
MFRFKCRACDEWHEGMPHIAAHAPLYYYGIPEPQRPVRCELTSDTCIVDGEFFFVRGVIEVPVEGLDEAFGWGVWVSLSEAHFEEYVAHFEEPGRGELGPYFGWLSAAIAGYPDTENLKTQVHPREPGIRPLIELEPTDHPLAVEQRNGIDRARLTEIYEAALHRG